MLKESSCLHSFWCKRYTRAMITTNHFYTLNELHFTSISTSFEIFVLILPIISKNSLWNVNGNLYNLIEFEILKQIEWIESKKKKKKKQMRSRTTANDYVYVQHFIILFQFWIIMYMNVFVQREYFWEESLSVFFLRGKWRRYNHFNNANTHEYTYISPAHFRLNGWNSAEKLSHNFTLIKDKYLNPLLSFKCWFIDNNFPYKPTTSNWDWNVCQITQFASSKLLHTVNQSMLTMNIYIYSNQIITEK